MWIYVQYKNEFQVEEGSEEGQMRKQIRQIMWAGNVVLTEEREVVVVEDEVGLVPVGSVECHLLGVMLILL